MNDLKVVFLADENLVFALRNENLPVEEASMALDLKFVEVNDEGSSPKFSMKCTGADLYVYFYL